MKNTKTLIIILVMIFMIAILNVFASDVSRSFSTNTPIDCSNLTITINVSLTNGENFFAIDEIYPTGWNLTNQSLGNISETGHIKWASVNDSSNHSFDYVISVPCNITGSYLFNGSYGLDSTLPQTPLIKGDNTVTIFNCTDKDGDGYSITGGVCGAIDCNDNNNTIWRNVNLFVDKDNDNFTVGNAVGKCIGTTPSGYKEIQTTTDCNDNNNTTFPGAIEVCNLVDDNCNGQIDEGVKLTFFRDFDNDTYGNNSVTTLACTAPLGYVANNTDCKDNNASIFQNMTGYADIDLDNYTVSSSSVVCTNGTLPNNYKSNVSNPTDCDDNNAAVVNCPASTSSGGSGGGSVIKIESNELTNGITVNVGRNDILKINYSNDWRYLKINNVTSTFITIGNNNITILNSQEFDLTNDSIKDIVITFDLFDGKKGNITIKKLSYDNTTPKTNLTSSIKQTNITVDDKLTNNTEKVEDKSTSSNVSVKTQDNKNNKSTSANSITGNVVNVMKSFSKPKVWMSIIGLIMVIVIGLGAYYWFKEDDVVIYRGK